MKRIAVTAAALCLVASQSLADDASCRAVRFSDVGWTDITSVTAVASVLLDALGYEPSTTLLSIPVTYVSMKAGDIDAYLGDWQPSMEIDRQPYLDDKSIEVVSTNLTGAKYTIAVPDYVAAEGVEDFADLDRFADRFGHEIYGIEPGNNGNRMILDMIAKDAFGLGDWTLVESTEQAMLAQVGRAIGQEKWIVFLGWEPHPMNTRFDMTYLSGGDDYFGPDFGGAEVLTDLRTGYREECPNAARFITNLKFTLPMENEIMGAILDDGKEPKAAATEWLKAHPDVIGPWLEGVTAFDGGDAEAAVKARLNL